MSDSASNRSNSGAELILLDPYCVFGRYFRGHEDKGKGGHR